MKKIYYATLTRIIPLAFLLFIFQSSSGQVEFRYLSGFGTALYDINDSGNAIQGGGVYSFATGLVTPVDTPATSLVGINNNGDLIGYMPIVISGTTLDQAAYKKNGTWYPMGFFPGATDQASVYQGQISESGNYISGQMSIDCCSQQAYLYNVGTGTIEELSDPANEYSAGYCINDDGVVGGWFDPLPVGTMRVPAYMRSGSIITAVPPGTTPTLSSINQVSAINNSNVMVGDRDGVPFIYDMATNTFTTYQVPTGYEIATFTSISDNGIAVGYCQNTFPSIVRDAIVFHPSLGSQPVLIRDVLASHGIDTVSTVDGLLGTAIAISPDGNFICGWENAFVAFASGWVINFSDSLISDCYATCPQDIIDISLTGPKVINYTIPITCSSNPAATVVLVSGLASGSLFPIGTTTVVHNLVDTNGTVLNSCSFDVILSDTYCAPSSMNNTPEPITLVNVADINNTSSETSINDYEDFTTVIGNVEIDSSYTATFKGVTNGNYEDFFTVYVDWNQDGYFTGSDERYEMGSIINSTGIDTVQTEGLLTVPSSALVGLTTMRVIKNYFEYITSPCMISSGYGQVEDYKLNVVSNPTGIKQVSSTNMKFYPNPVEGILNVSNSSVINSIAVYNLVGQEVIYKNLNSMMGQINLSELPSGVYMIKAISGNSLSTFKINKQ